MNRSLLIILALILVVNGFLIWTFFSAKNNLQPRSKTTQIPKKCIDLTLGDNSSRCYVSGTSKKGNYLWILGKVKKYTQSGNNTHVHIASPYTADELDFMLNGSTLTTCKLSANTLNGGTTNCGPLNPSKVSSLIKVGSNVILTFYGFPIGANDTPYSNCHAITDVFMKSLIKSNNLDRYKQVLNNTCAPIIGEILY